MGLLGLKSRCCQVCILLGDYRENLSPCFFKLLKAAHIPHHDAHRIDSNLWFLVISLLPFVPSSPFTSGIPLQLYWAHPHNQRKSPHLKILNFSHLQSILSSKVTFLITGFGRPVDIFGL